MTDLEELVHEAFNDLEVESASFAVDVHVSLQILLAVLEHTQHKSSALESMAECDRWSNPLLTSKMRINLVSV